MKGFCAAVVVGVALASCSAQGVLGNQLSGSVAKNEDLQFDEVLIHKFSTGELRVRYQRSKNGNSEIVAQVTVTPPPSGVTYGQSIDLKTHNGSVRRVIQDGTDFPALKLGQITFDSGASEAGDATRGSFNATFENDKTLNGKFDAALQLITN